MNTIVKLCVNESIEIPIVEISRNLYNRVVKSEFHLLTVMECHCRNDLIKWDLN